MIRRALIPLDGSELAEQVMLRFVAPERTELLLMTALPSPLLPLLNNTVKPRASERIATFNEDEANEQVHAVAQQLNRNGSRAGGKFLSGTPADGILRLTEEAHVDLIAMSTHGRRGLGLALLGSVADEVEFATLEWVDWFNNRRLLEPIGNILPTEFEMAYYRQLRESVDAA